MTDRAGFVEERCRRQRAPTNNLEGLVALRERKKRGEARGCLGAL
jgi:hypothetical protein